MKGMLRLLALLALLVLTSTAEAATHITMYLLAMFLLPEPSASVSHLFMHHVIDWRWQFQKS